MKYKAIRPWEAFWKRTFDYIINNNIEAFDAIVYLTMVPTILHKRNKMLNKFLENMQRLMKVDIKVSTEYIMPAFYLARVFHSYLNTGRLPVANYQGLIYMYEAIMNDYKDCDMDKITWDVLSKDFGIEDSKITPRCCFVIYHILHEDGVEEMKKFLQMTREEEDKFSTTADKEVVVEEYLAKGTVYHSIHDDVIPKYGIKYGNDLTLVAKAIGGRIENDMFVAPKELVEFYYGLLLGLEHRMEAAEEYTKLIEDIEKRYESIKTSYKADMQFMQAEREALIEKLNNAKSEKHVVYVDNEDKYKAEMHSLEAQYNSKIAELQKQIEDLKDMVSELAAKKDESIKPVKLPKMADVVYFALEDPQLDGYIAQYNVSLRHMSPLTPPKSVPDLPIAFNIDVASHKVWNKIKDKKPLILSGSNKEIIAAKITSWLSK